MGEAAVLMATLTAGVVLASLARARGAWVGTRLAAAGLGASVLFQIGWWVARSVGHGQPNGQLFAGTATLLLLTFLATLSVDFFEHIQEGRAELLSDIVLVSTLAGVAVFVLMHQEALGQPSVWGFALTALIAASAILVVVGWGVLALWCPSSVHLALFACATVLGSSALALDDTRHFGTGLHSLLARRSSPRSPCWRWRGSWWWNPGSTPARHGPPARSTGSGRPSSSSRWSGPAGSSS